ncbi:MAG: hypothetical protein K9L98_03890 [Candidatus Pacebacteria bacterium]|nr:hypothetical protein [Candidatus Paceibacterota bacterium]MCF7863117.1 hypothetical protein [Candidatus Paceibacterota bacterium]
MRIVTVIPLKKGFLKNDLTYFSAKNIQEGYVVEIPIKGKKSLGLVVASEEAKIQKSEIKDMPFGLRKIEEVKGQSIWKEELIDTIRETAQYFAVSKNQVATTFIPTIFREKYDVFNTIKNISKEYVIEIKSPKDEENIRAEKSLFQAPTEDRLSFYKTLIRGCFAEKKSIFIVLPTERDISFFKEYLSKGIENFIFSFHSGMTEKKITEEYKKCLSEEHSVLILGTTPYLSVPRRDVKVVILEIESSPVYKLQNKPYIDMRIFAEIFAHKIKAKFILGDTLLRMESLAKQDSILWNSIQGLSFRNNFEGNILITDKYKRIDAYTEEKKFNILSEEGIEKILDNINNGKNTFIFSLRKGLATYTLCGDCQEALLCDNCSAPITLYLSKDGQKRMFSCNKCRSEKNPEMTCPNCQSWNLISFGIGTETIYEELQKIIKQKIIEDNQKDKKTLKIFRLDKESVKTAKGAEKIIEEFESTDGSILVGTELALFYLHKKVFTSLIASFDSLWSIPSFRMSEKMIHIVSSILNKTENTLIIETRNPEDEGINAFYTDTISHFIKKELADRKILGYPPYKRFIKISFSGEKDKTSEAKKILEELFSKYNPDIFGGFMPKVKGKYIINALIKIEPENWTVPDLYPDGLIIEDLYKRLTSLPPVFSVNVDPEDIL